MANCKACGTWFSSTAKTKICPTCERALKPCPFCGGKPYLETHHRAFINAQTTKVAFVRCRACEARTQRFALRDFGCSSYSEEANHKAIEAWNRRAEDG